MSTRMNNDIEKILAQGSKNFEVLPPEQVWQNIKQGKNSRYIFFFRLYKWRIASLIALLALVSTGLYYFNITEVENTKVTTKESENTGINIPETITENSSNDGNSTSTGENSEKVKKESLTPEKSSPKTSQKTNIAKSNYKKPFLNNGNNNVEENEEEIFANTDKYNVFEIISKNIKGLKYSTNPKFEEYTPVNKKSHKSWVKNKEKENNRNAKQGWYSLEIGGGPSYACRNLSGGNYLLRNESEKAMISFQTNVKVNYHLNNKFSVQSGITIETRNEKLNYNHSELQKKLVETPRTITVFHPVLPPKNITVIDSSYVNQTIKYDFENINKYTTFNIPVLIGYNFGNSKLQYRIAAGTLINVISFNNAKIVEKNGSETVLVKYNEPKKINPSIYSAVAMNKVINNHYSIVFELSYYRNMLNRFGAESATKQINSGINFTSAIRYNILR